MRYGNPSISEGLAALHQQGVTEVLLIPLYPQYAMATSETIEVLAEKLIREHYPQMVLHKFAPFFHRKEYIEALAGVTRPILSDYHYDHLLFSYHGVPERHLYKTSPTPAHKHIEDGKRCCDPYSAEGAHCYRSHCFETTRLLAEVLQLPKDKYSISFQSRLGADKWLTPFTSNRIKALAQSGVKRLAVITPAFVADCVETLEEIEMVGGKTFVENGGESFKLIPCLNDSELWAKALAQWIKND